MKIAQALMNGDVAFLDSERPSRSRAVWLLALAAASAFDIVNFLVLRYHFRFFLSHYFYYSSFVTMFLYSNAALRSKAARLEGRLRALRDETMSRLAGGAQKSTTTIRWLAEQTADLVGARSTSILEFTGEHHKFLGTHGSPRLHDPEIIQSVRAGATRKGHDDRSDWHVVPLVIENQVGGALCLSEYRHGWMMPFFEQRLPLIQSEVQPCINILFAKREAQIKSALVDIEREKSHPLLFTTEENLLTHFVVAESQSAYAFIMGDLVGSVSLRETFGSQSVDRAIAASLERLWDRCHSLGVVIDIREGDAFSVTVPELVTDAPAFGAVDRALAAVDAWNDLAPELPAIAREHGIYSEFLFRAAMGVAEALEGQTGLKRFEFQANPAKDTAARVLKEVCLPGESIVIGRAAADRARAGLLIGLTTRRLRGKLASTDVFLVKTKLAADAE